MSATQSEAPKRVIPPPARVLLPAKAHKPVDPYQHALRTVAWALFWFSIVGGTTASVVVLEVNALQLPLALLSFLSWGMLAAAVSLASRQSPTR